MRGECLMLLRLVLEGEEHAGLGMPGPKARATGVGRGTRGDSESSVPQKPSTGCDSAYRQRNSRSKSSTMRPLRCSTILVWAWLQSQVKLGAEGLGQERKCRARASRGIITREACWEVGQDSTPMRLTVRGQSLNSRVCAYPSPAQRTWAHGCPLKA